MIRTIGFGALLAGSMSLSAPAAMAAEFINVLAGGTSGVYYPLGVALADIYGQNIPDARTQVQSTKASVENLNLLQQGRGEIGFALGDSVKDAFEGNEDVGFTKPLDKLRAIAAIYPNYIQIAASAESGAVTVSDLVGKSVSVGAAKSGTEVNARKILGALDMSYDDLGKVESLPFAESVELMKNRQLDATLQSSGLGSAALKDLSSTQDVTYVSIPAEVAGTLGAPYAAGVIPAGT
ncbi:TAXI family TRAP transporter solute-binding subunit, partial [Salipiger sp. HF18]|nr:TAXI family TRAP transporter solute-binding subunit [Salipiger sp. HF18]